MSESIVKGLVEVFSWVNAREREKLFPPPTSFPPDYTPTDRILHKMLTENTGAHILDSGDIYGRNWERWRLVNDLRVTPKVSLEVWDDEVLIYYNIFHFLRDHLKYHKELDRDFHKFANSEEWRDKPWYECIEEWQPKDYERAGSCNTYNFENILSQVIQFTEFHYKGDPYLGTIIVLQTHNGCDVRGGYSTPHVFQVYDRDYFYMAMTDIYASCRKCGAHWQSDDSGYHWYDDKPNWQYHSEENKVTHGDGCGGEIKFWVLDHW